MSDSIKTTALRWLMRLSLGQPTERDCQRFTAWCAANPLHARAYRRVADLWSETSHLEDLRYLIAVEPPARGSRT